MAARIIDELLRSDDPSVRWKARTRVLGEAEDSRPARRLRREIRDSPRVRRMLAGRGPDGRVATPATVYGKWQGAHWVLAGLADLGYPPGDPALRPVRDQVQDTWLSWRYFQEFDADKAPGSYGRPGVPRIRGRYRRCASQQGNALRALSVLGLTDDRTDQLAERLLVWQWPDGGWNCDRNPEASVSSFYETLLPMRGLGAYAAVSGRVEPRRAAGQAAEVFLRRRMLYRLADGQVMNPDFARLHYPLYWHYDILGGLLGLAELGLVTDDRCRDALDLLEAKRLPDGGWPAERRYYRVSARPGGGTEYVDWGGTSVRRSNPWVTVDALTVLVRAGRISP